MNVVSEKATVRYCYRNNRKMMAIGFPLMMGIALIGLLMVFGLSQLTQEYWEKELWPGSLRFLIMLNLAWIIEKGVKKYFGQSSRVSTFTIMVVVFILFLCFLPPFPSIFPSLALVLFKGIFGFAAIFLGIIPFWGMYSMWSKQSTPALVLDHNGMWVDRYGLIPWNNIAAVSASAKPEPPCLFIKVKDSETLRAQATCMGKLFLMVANKFGKLVYSPGYHISATGLDTPNDTIIAFANQYMQHDAQN